MGAYKHILLLIIDFLCSWYEQVYALFPHDLNSDWEEITCRAPQGTKLTALLFLVVIDYVKDNIDDQFKYVDNLSALLKFIVYTTKAMPQFSPDLLAEFKEECSTNSLQINKSSTKIWSAEMRFCLPSSLVSACIVSSSPGI
ncbi:hypothetical protein QYM36_011237 [Artemia franciscana]|uniref:Reverse transcriptase domain-containing protein n=1 Tax=Artemia franciscana TaxID=6661 RepID=A0AA88HRD1_ARTSF|nr:hypothetical protein QYM36_011237 [Artemia franciscana]